MRASAELALSTRGLGSEEGCQLRTKGSREPSTAVNSATAAPSAIAHRTRRAEVEGVRARAVTSTPSGTASIQGTIDP